jgi:hypothetical protein
MDPQYRSNLPTHDGEVASVLKIPSWEVHKWWFEYFVAFEGSDGTICASLKA